MTLVAIDSTSFAMRSPRPRTHWWQNRLRLCVASAVDEVDRVDKIGRTVDFVEVDGIDRTVDSVNFNKIDRVEVDFVTSV